MPANREKTVRNRLLAVSLGLSMLPGLVLGYKALKREDPTIGERYFWYWASKFQENGRKKQVEGKYGIKIIGPVSDDVAGNVDSYFSEIQKSYPNFAKRLENASVVIYPEVARTDQREFELGREYIGIYMLYNKPEPFRNTVAHCVNRRKVMLLPAEEKEDLHKAWMKIYPKDSEKLQFEFAVAVAMDAADRLLSGTEGPYKMRMDAFSFDPRAFALLSKAGLITQTECLRLLSIRRAANRRY